MIRKYIISSFLIILVFLLSCQNKSGIVSKSAEPAGLANLASLVRPDFLIGSFYTPGHHGLDPDHPDNETIKEFIKDNYNIITVGIFMFGMQKDSGVYDPLRMANIDNTVKFASENNIKVYFHPMIGGANYSPEWINKGHFKKDELQKIMRERITFVLNRYKSRVQYVDVVNECLASGNRTETGEFDWRKDDGKGVHVWMRDLGMYHGKKYTFPQYLVDAFRISREVGGQELRLILNEYDNESLISPKGITFFNLIEAMREEGIPVDGAGLQMHCWIKDGKFCSWNNVPFDFDSFDSMLRKYEEAGIDVHITEFDIHLPEKPSDADLNLQGESYANILRHALSCPAVKSFKTWGFTDKWAWKIDGVQTYPVILDENFKPKPAYTSEIGMLKSLIKTR